MLRILLIQKKLQKKIKSLLVILIMIILSFPMQEKDFTKIEVKNNICINVFGYQDEMVFPTYDSDQKFEDSMNLLF